MLQKLGLWMGNSGKFGPFGFRKMVRKVMSFQKQDKDNYSSIFPTLKQGGNCLGVCESLHVVSFRMGVGLKSSKPTEAQNKKQKN